MATPSWATPIKKSNIPDWATPVKDDESTLSKVGNFAADTFTDIGDKLGRGLGYVAGDFVNAPIAVGDLLNRGVAHLLGTKAPTAAYFDAKAVTPMVGVDPAVQQDLDSDARAFATGAEYALPVVDTAKLATMGGKALAGKISSLAGLNADEKATDFIRGLIRNQPQIKEAFAKSYGEVGDKAAQRGYNLDVHKTQRPIESPLFNSTMNKMDFNARKAIRDNLSSEAKDALEQFANKPSYENAHGLQSILGREGIDLTKARDTARIGKNILTSRNSLNKDIHNSFINNGDNDLAAMRQEITKHYAENENRLMLADKLKPGVSNLPVGGLTANAKKIVNSYGKADFKQLLGRPGAKIKNEETDAAIADIQNSLARQKNIKDIYKKLKWPIRGALLGAGFGGYKEFF